MNKVTFVKSNTSCNDVGHLLLTTDIKITIEMVQSKFAICLRITSLKMIRHEPLAYIYITVNIHSLSLLYALNQAKNNQEPNL
jgi:hypothetical protein